MSKQKIIITIEDDIKPDLAVSMVELVVKSGKISQDTKGRKYYCWGQLLETDDGRMVVYTRKTRNENTASFVVQKYEYEL